MAKKEMMPPSQHNPHTWEIIAAFAFGVVFLAAMLTIAIFVPNPSPFASFVFRVVLAMAAAGVAALIPGFLQVNVPPYIRAGGAIAVFVIVYWFNPPQLINPPSPDATMQHFSEAMQRGDSALAGNEPSAAISYYQQALVAKPDSWMAHLEIGEAQYELGNFAAALDYFKKAFGLKEEKDGAIAHSIAMAQEALGHYEEAEESLLLAIKFLPDNSPLALTVVFDGGLINLILWLKQDAPKDNKRYRDAELAFQSFLERRGFPPQWAHYHLACLRATRAEDQSLPPVDVTTLRTGAIQMLEDALKELDSYASTKAPLQREMMRRLLQAPEGWSRRAGDPVSCPALVWTWIAERGPVSDLIARLK